MSLAKLTDPFIRVLGPINDSSGTKQSFPEAKRKKNEI